MSETSIKPWMAVYCKARNEKKVSERLKAKGFEAYCPLKSTKKKWSDRIKTVIEPVIASYVFVRCSEAERLSVLQDPAILNFVFYLGKPALIRDIEMDRLKYIMGEQNSTQGDIVFDHFEPGDKVRLLKQGFVDMEGVLQKIDKHRVSVLLEGIGLVLSLAKSHVEKKT